MLVHGLDVRVELVREDTHFLLGFDRLGTDVLGAPPDWVEVSADVVEFSSQRGDLLVDQRPNCGLEVGTLSVTLVDASGAWIPDDLARLLGLPPTGLRAGNRIRVVAYRPGVTVPDPVFLGTVTEYVGDWLTSDTRIIDIAAVDDVSVVSAVNPIAQRDPSNDGDYGAGRWRKLAELTPVECAWGWNPNYNPPCDVQFREDTFGEPLVSQWQLWADTAVMHLGVRHVVAADGTVTPQLVTKPVGQVDNYMDAWRLVDCLYYPPPVRGHLTPTVGTVTTPDPGPLPDACTLVAHVDASGGSNQVIVGQAEAEGTLSWYWRRYSDDANLNVTLSPNGSYGTVAGLWGLVVPPPLSGERFLASALSLAAGTLTTYTSPDGAAWSQSGGGALGAPWVAFDSSALLRVGAFGYGDAWQGRIYSVELRSGLDPTGGTVLWRFDAADYPGGGATTYTDPRGRTWTLTTPGAITPTTPAPGTMPLHLGQLVTTTAGVVNDCLGSADRPGDQRYDAVFSVYPGTSAGGLGVVEIMTSDGGTTWGALLGGDRNNVMDPAWSALPADGTADLEMDVIGYDGVATGRGWKWNVQGVPVAQGPYLWWLPGLIDTDGHDYPYGQRLRVGFHRTSATPPDHATAVRAVDEQSAALHGVQDYRRFDLPLRYATADATTWADSVVNTAAEATTYLDSAEVHLHRPEATDGLRIDLLDRVTCTKQFPTFGDQVLSFTADVVGIEDALDQTGWVRTLHLAPVGTPQHEGTP